MCAVEYFTEAADKWREFSKGCKHQSTKDAFLKLAQDLEHEAMELELKLRKA